jgi:integrase
MTWQRIERGLRKYEGKNATTYQVLLRVGCGVVCETFGNERNARERLAELRVGRKKGDLQYKNVRLGSYLEKWLKRYAYYVDIINRYFGANTQLKRISIALIRDFETYLANELGLSANVQSNIFVTLKRGLNDAREEGYNVVVAPSKRKRIKKNHVKRQKHLESHELELFLSTASSYGSVYRDLFEFLAFTGCRVSEALPLSFADVDFINRKIHINKRRYEGDLGEPKTDSSNRIIEMYSPVYEMLQRRRKEVSKLYMKYPEHRDLDLVFPSQWGGYRAYPVIIKIFKRSLRKAGLSQDFSLHDLRHTFASFLFSMTQNIVYVQKQLGHSNPSITLSIYTHLLQEDHTDITKAINKDFATFFNKHLIKAVNK